MSGEEVEALRTKLAKKEEANQKLKANLVGAVGLAAMPRPPAAGHRSLVALHAG